MAPNEELILFLSVMAMNGLFCADVRFRNYSLTLSVNVQKNTARKKQKYTIRENQSLYT